MARKMEEVLVEQLGSLTFLLCVKDVELERLREENKALKSEKEANDHSQS